MNFRYNAPTKAREKRLAQLLAEGCKAAGHNFNVWRGEKEFDFHSPMEVEILFGVKSAWRMDFYRKVEQRYIVFDKGYVRGGGDGDGLWGHLRFAVDDLHPTQYLMNLNRPRDRHDALGIDVKPWRIGGDTILIAASTQKLHHAYGAPPPDEYWADKIPILEGFGKKVVYRTKTGRIPIRQALQGCHSMVTLASNAVYEAIAEGVPCVVLGEGIGKVISSTKLTQADDPYLATDAERRQWFSNLAYCQWTPAEIADGSAVREMVRQLEETS